MLWFRSVLHPFHHFKMVCLPAKGGQLQTYSILKPTSLSLALCYRQFILHLKNTYHCSGETGPF